jgi:hypothetical protein
MPIRSGKVIENIQLLHECKKDRDEHLLQVIAEAQTDNDTIDPRLLPGNRDTYGEHDMDDGHDLLELLQTMRSKNQLKINILLKLLRLLRALEDFVILTVNIIFA